LGNTKKWGRRHKQTYLANVLDDDILKGDLAPLEEVGEVLALVLGADCAADGVSRVQECLDGVAVESVSDVILPSTYVAMKPDAPVRRTRDPGGTAGMVLV
jgi:hypothetical protein